MTWFSAAMRAWLYLPARNLPVPGQPRAQRALRLLHNTHAHAASTAPRGQHGARRHPDGQRVLARVLGREVEVEGRGAQPPIAALEPSSSRLGHASVR